LREPSFIVINVAYIIGAKRPVVGYTQTPANYTSKPYQQRVYPVYEWGNVWFNESCSCYAMNITPGSYGGFVVKVSSYGRPLDLMLRITKLALANPRLNKEYDKVPIPENIISSYVKKPHRLVIEKVKPIFEEKIERVTDLHRMSKISLAYSLAYFSYREFLEYDPSLIPRKLEEAIERRKGDCSEMSMILMSLLWSYGIPAKQIYGHVYFANYTENLEVNGSLYLLRNAAPHVFVMAYLQPLGWVSLDLLAGSLICYPFITEDETTNVDFTDEDIINVARKYSEYRFIQLREIIDAKTFKKLTRNGTEIWRLREYVERELMSYLTEMGVRKDNLSFLLKTR